MKKILVTCDHCGKELNGMHDYLDQEIGFMGYETADFCAECIEELDGIIKKFVGKDKA